MPLRPKRTYSAGLVGMEVIGQRLEVRSLVPFTSLLTHYVISDIAMTSSFPIATMSTLTTKPIALTLSVHETSTPSPSASALSSSKKVNTGAIIGIVIGILLLVALASAIALFIHKRRQHQNHPGEGETVANHPDHPFSIKEKAELEAQTEQVEIQQSRDSQHQVVEERGNINAIHRDEDSVSTESGDDVLIFQGIRVSELGSS